MNRPAPKTNVECVNAYRRRKAECTPLADPFVITRGHVDMLMAWGFLWGENEDSDPAKIKQAFAEWIAYLPGTDL